MNLIEQFPDVSLQMRARVKRNRAVNSISNATVQPYDIDKALAKYYQGEFRKWHFKLALIVGGILVILFSLILNAPGFFNWIVS